MSEDERIENITRYYGGRRQAWRVGSNCDDIRHHRDGYRVVGPESEWYPYVLEHWDLLLMTNGYAEVEPAPQELERRVNVNAARERERCREEQARNAICTQRRNDRLSQQEAEAEAGEW